MIGSLVCFVYNGQWLYSVVKPFNPAVETDTQEADDEGYTDSNLCNTKHSGTATESLRPKRVAKLPEKFKDFVMQKPK